MKASTYPYCLGPKQIPLHFHVPLLVITKHEKNPVSALSKEVWHIDGSDIGVVQKNVCGAFIECIKLPKFKPVGSNMHLQDIINFLATASKQEHNLTYRTTSLSFNQVALYFLYLYRSFNGPTGSTFGLAPCFWTSSGLVTLKIVLHGQVQAFPPINVSH